MTQMEKAKKGKFTGEMRKVASQEGCSPDKLSEAISRGRAVFPCNGRRKVEKACVIGEGFRTKVNANLGTSQDCAQLKEELAKLKVAVKAGADTIMDLSTGGDLDKIRREVLAHSPVPVGTVPIYQAAIEAVSKTGSIFNMEEEAILAIIEKQMEDGVDFVAVHCGLTQATLERVRHSGRLTNIISRGGAFLAEWMIVNKKENPLYASYDRLLSLARAHDVVLSLGDAMRPGCLADATDGAQLQETIILGELAERAWKENVQVMIEGPGHIPLHRVEANIVMIKELCHGAPLYVLGPLVTDVAPGYDHITAAIGGAAAGAAGADFLCYVTPAEHLRLPTVEDVREGVIVTRLAAHSADIAKGVAKADEWDRKMSTARAARDWKAQIRLSLDPQRAKELRGQRMPREDDVCTMCGSYCALKQIEGYFRSRKKKSPKH